MKSLTALTILLLIGAGAYYAMNGNPFGGAGGGQAVAQGERGQSRQNRGAPVEVALARKGTATDDLWSIGSLRSDESVEIASEVVGRIAEITFKEGEAVKAGDVLVKLDDSLAQAELADAKAKLDLAQANFDRAQSLSRSGSGTERALDEARSALQVGRAASQLAEARLAKLSIRAPFDGHVGLRGVSPGAYATPGEAIVNLAKIDQLKLDFRVPETRLTQISVGQDVELTMDSFPDRRFGGKIYAIDPQLDVNGRSLRIRARLPNPEMVLRPGLFARVIIKGLEERQVVRVPESAVVPNGENKFVYSIVGGKAKENKVTTGRRRAGEVEILQGIEAGTQVITSGQTRLRDGMQVEVIAGPTASAERS